MQLFKDRLVVVLSTSVYVFNLLQGFAVELHIKTCPNPRGACAIGSTQERPVLATLAKDEGEVTVQNYFLNSLKVVRAFPNAVQNLALSIDVNRER